MPGEFPGSRDFHDAEDYHRRAAENIPVGVMARVAQAALTDEMQNLFPAWTSLNPTVRPRSPFGSRHVAFKRLKNERPPPPVPRLADYLTDSIQRSKSLISPPAVKIHQVDFKWIQHNTQLELLSQWLLPPAINLPAYLTGPTSEWKDELTAMKAVVRTPVLLYEQSAHPAPILERTLANARVLLSSISFALPQLATDILVSRQEQFNDFLLDDMAVLLNCKGTLGEKYLRLKEASCLCLPQTIPAPESLDYLGASALPDRDQCNYSVLKSMAGRIPRASCSTPVFQFTWTDQPTKRPEMLLDEPVVTRYNTEPMLVADFQCPAAVTKVEAREILDNFFVGLAKVQRSTLPPAARIFTLPMDPMGTQQWDLSSHYEAPSTPPSLRDVLQGIESKTFTVGATNHGLETLFAVLAKAVESEELRLKKWFQYACEIAKRNAMIILEDVELSARASDAAFPARGLDWDYDQPIRREDESLAECLIPFESRKRHTSDISGARKRRKGNPLNVNFADGDMASFMNLVAEQAKVSEETIPTNVVSPVTISIPKVLEPSSKDVSIGSELLGRRALLILPRQNEYSTTSILFHTYLTHIGYNHSMLWIGSNLEDVRRSFLFHHTILGRENRVEFLGRRDIDEGSKTSQVFFSCCSDSIPPRLRARQFSCVVFETALPQKFSEELRIWFKRSSSIVVTFKKKPSIDHEAHYSLRHHAIAISECLSLTHAVVSENTACRPILDLLPSPASRTLRNLAVESAKYSDVAFDKNSMGTNYAATSIRSLSLRSLENAIDRMLKACHEKGIDSEREPRVRALVGLHVLRSVVEHFLLDGTEQALAHLEESIKTLPFCGPELRRCLPHLGECTSTSEASLLQSTLRENISNYLLPDKKNLVVFPSARGRDHALRLNPEAGLLETRGDNSIIFCHNAELEGCEAVLSSFDRVLDVSVDLHGAIEGPAKAQTQALVNAGKLELKYLSVASFDEQAVHIPHDLDSRWSSELKSLARDIRGATGIEVEVDVIPLTTLAGSKGCFNIGLGGKMTPNQPRNSSRV